MSDTTGVPVTESEGVTYADVSDINDILRSFEFTDTSNPTTTQVNNLLKKKTRKAEKEISTSFRVLEVSDITVDGTPSTKQRRDKLGRGGRFNARGSGLHRTSTDRWIKFQLPNYFLQDVSKLVVKSSTGEHTIDLNDSKDDDLYMINYRDGSIKIDYTAFPFTGDGTAGSDRLIDCRIETTYTYGRDFIEPDIKEAVSKMVVYDLINSDAFSEIRSEEDSFVDLETFTERLESESQEILEKYKY